MAKQEKILIYNNYLYKKNIFRFFGLKPKKIYDKDLKLKIGAIKNLLTLDLFLNKKKLLSNNKKSFILNRNLNIKVSLKFFIIFYNIFFKLKKGTIFIKMKKIQKFIPLKKRWFLNKSKIEIRRKKSFISLKNFKTILFIIILNNFLNKHVEKKIKIIFLYNKSHSHRKIKLKKKRRI